MKHQKKEFQFKKHEKVPLRIVADAAIATVGVGDGRLIPHFIIDTTERLDIDELVRIHRYVEAGDMNRWWGQIQGHKGTIGLFIQFIRPAEVTMVMEFDLLNQGPIVDQIMMAKALYLQPGRPGDRLSTTMDNLKILIELGDSGFQSDWNKIYRKAIIKRMREKGLSRRESNQAADGFINEWRSLAGTRVNR
jgi:hypothetical protein